jgi:hypothetical protein
MAASLTLESSLFPNILSPRGIRLVSTDNAQSVFAWQAHPARERRAGASAALIVIAGLTAAAYLSFGVAWAVLTVVVLVLALNRFFFPSRFEIDDQGITARYPLRRQRFQWRNLRRFVHDEHGGYLSTRARRSRFDAYSGMHLLFGTKPETVIQQIQSRVQQNQLDEARSCPS